jgi:hypothetical protein
MKIVIVSLIQAIYVIYMLNYFKTIYSIAHPITLFDNNLIYHPIGTAEKPISNICKLGHILSWYLGAFLIVRSLFLYKNIYKKQIKIISLVGLIIGIILSMMNFNAVLYLLPHFIMEIYFQYIDFSL